MLAWAADRFPGRVVLTCSWQRQSGVLVHLVASAGLDIRIVELDTGLLFPETLQTRDRLVERYGVTVETIHPRRTVAEQAEKFGDALWERHPDRCCAMRKVEPLERALAESDCWVSGIRREQSATRATTRKVEIDRSRGVVKVAPLADWTKADVVAFVRAPRHPDEPALRPGLPVDRLLALHAAGGRGRGRARGSLGRARQDRVRPARPGLTPGRAATLSPLSA